MPVTPEGFDSTPPARTAVPSTDLLAVDPTADLRRISAIKDDQAASAANAKAAPVIERKKLPALTETVETGYSRGKPLQVTLVKIGWERVEKFTGYDFLLMQQAAAKDGIKRPINHGFRDMETQTRLYLERKDEPARSTKGPAAKPGWSNHQSGTAVDLNTAMTLADKQAKKYSAVYLWLVDNAHKFGFYNTDIPAPPRDEPWHWVHTAKELVGAGSIDEILSAGITSDSATVPAVAGTNTPVTTQVAREIYDRTKAYERSYQAARTTRDVHLASQARHAILGSADLQHTAVQCVTTLAQLTQDVPEPVKDSTVKSEVFNFETGLWGDDKAV